MITVKGVSTLPSGGLMLVYFDVQIDGKNHHWEDVAPYLIGDDLLNLLRSREVGYVADILAKKAAWEASGKTKEIADESGKTVTVPVSETEVVRSTLVAEHVAKSRERERWVFAESKESFDSLKSRVEVVEKPEV